jgi:hypothetical protein
MGELEWTGGIGLVLPERRAALTLALSSYGEREPYAGAPRPLNRSAMALSARGAAPATPLEVRTQNGGQPGIGRGASYVYRPEGGAWLGVDDPGSITGFRNLVPASAGEPLETAQPLDALDIDGSVFIPFYGQYSTGDQNRLSVAKVSPTGAVTIALVAALPNTASPAAAICRLPSGLFLLLVPVRDTVSGFVQLRLYISGDAGETWGLGADSVLVEPIPTAGGDNTVTGISAAVVDGTVSMFISVDRSVFDTYRNQVYQFASRDGGNNFELVYQTNEGTTVTGLKSARDVAVRATASNSLVVAWIGEDGFSRVTRIGSPYDAIDLTPPVSVADTRAAINTGVTTGRAGQAIAVSPDGTIYLAGPALVSSGQARRVLQSLDGGRTWGPSAEGIGRSGLVWRLPALPSRGLLAAWAGGLLAVSGGSNTSPFIASVFGHFLGGASNHTFPPYYSTDARGKQAANVAQWVGDADPVVLSYVSSSGVGSASPIAQGFDIATGAGETLVYTETLSEGTAIDHITKGTTRTYSQTVVSGGDLGTNQIATRIEAGSGSSRIRFELRHSATGARVWDIVASAAVGADISGLVAGTRYDWRIVQINTAVRVFYRVWSPTNENPWILGISGAISIAAAPSSALTVTWGHLSAPPVFANSVWHSSGTCYAEWTGSGFPLALNAEDLHGGYFSPRASVLGGTGVTLTAKGLTYRGDTWRISADSDYRLTNVFQGSPRVDWRSVDTAAQSLTFELSGHNTVFATDTLVIAGFSSNIGRVRIVGIAHSGVETELFEGSLSANMEGLTYTANGNAVKPSATTPPVKFPTFAAHELAGAIFAAYDTAGTAWVSRYIADNREGKWSNSSGTARTVLVTEGEVPTALTGTDGRIIPKDWAVQVSLRGAAYRRIRLEIPTPNTSTIPAPPEGYWKLGRLIVGFAITQATLPSWRDRVTHESNEEITTSRDYQRAGIQLAPASRVFRLGFVDGTVTVNVGSPTGEGDPDFYRLESGGEGAGLQGLELHTLDGVLRAVGGTRELVYLSDLKAGVANAVHNRRDRVALVALDSDTARERFAGFDVHTGDAIRGDAFDLREIV